MKQWSLDARSQALLEWSHGVKGEEWTCAVERRGHEPSWSVKWRQSLSF